MSDMEKPPRQPGQSQLADYPELPITKEWGALVRARRTELGWSQAELADRIGVEQPMIHMIESGKSKSSRAVVPLVNLLNIAMPKQFFDDDVDERWITSGRVLRRINPKGFDGLLTAAEGFIARSGDDGDER